MIAMTTSNSIKVKPRRERTDDRLLDTTARRLLETMSEPFAKETGEKQNHGRSIWTATGPFMGTEPLTGEGLFGQASSPRK
jgi:hypothetical protein